MCLKVTIDEIKAMAKNGNPDAQFELSSRYFSGTDVKPNRKFAVKWLTLAAEQGHLAAMRNLARRYESGIENILEKNHNEAIRLWHAAALRGDPKAQHYMGVCCKKGYMTEQNVQEALTWWNAAASQGHKQSMCKIGGCYYEGSGVEQNYEEALKWFILAAKPNESGYVENEALEWIAECYYFGRGVERNLKNAIELWEILAETSYEVKMKLAEFYSDGVEIEKDFKKALYWWNDAATNEEGDPLLGMPEARCEIARCYYEGRGVEKDRRKGLAEYKLALKAFRNQEPKTLVSNEPGHILMARALLVKYGDSAVIADTIKSAEKGDPIAAAMLQESEIEFRVLKKAKDPEVKAAAAVEETPAPIICDSIRLPIGTKVLSPAYGKGRVCEISPAKLQVEFKSVGKKWFVNPSAFNQGYLSVLDK